VVKGLLLVKAYIGPRTEGLHGDGVRTEVTYKITEETYIVQALLVAGQSDRRE
jgi:hypothetical protein